MKFQDDSPILRLLEARGKIYPGYELLQIFLATQRDMDVIQGL